jgi:hypothetical protein
MTEQSTAAPNDGSANPAGGDWRTAFGAEASKTLESFKEPGEFLKAYQAVSTERDTLKSGAPAFDWRKEITGGDEKALKTFERFSTMQDAGKAYLEAVNKIRSGELAKPLPANATTEQVAEWRKANGIPEKPEAYFEKLPNGRVIGKDDQPLFNDVAAKLHAHNVSPAAMHELVEWYYQREDGESAKLSEADKAEAKAAEDKLREAWGPDYRANENHLENYLTGLPEGLQKAFRDGFGGDGRKLMHNPEFKQWMSNIAREFNPQGMVTPGGNESSMQTINEELAKLTKMAGDHSSDYWRGPLAGGHQKRMLELLAAQDKLSKRVA